MDHGREPSGDAGTTPVEALAARIFTDLGAAPIRPCPPLFQAVEDGRIADVRRLIEEGADVNYDSGGGWTPLVHAIDVESDAAWQRHHEPGRGSTELAELLLAAGAVPTDEAFAIAQRYQNRKAEAVLERYQRRAEPGAAPDCGGRTAFPDS